jgi:hypothetical protein
VIQKRVGAEVYHRQLCNLLDKVIISCFQIKSENKIALQKKENTKKQSMFFFHFPGKKSNMNI